jgi:hypothetical protein
MILNDDDLTAALELANRFWNAPIGTPDADMLDELVDEIERYENSVYFWEDDGGKPKD